MRLFRQRVAPAGSGDAAHAWEARLASLLPEQHRHLAGDRSFLERLRWCVHPGFYAAQLTPEERLSVDDVLDANAALDHFVAEGARAGKRVCALFNPDWYADRLTAVGGAVPDGDIPFFHWLTVGWQRRIVPTPLFDETFYIEQHLPMQTHPRWVFQHYLSRGCYQATWVPSPYGAHHAGEKPESDVPDPLMLPELLHRADEYDLSRTSWLEEGVLAAMRQHERLSSPTLRAMLEKAAEAEPLVQWPKRVTRPVTSALHRHPRLRMIDEIEAARREIGTDHVDTVILVPHCRMGGAARVAGIFAHAVQAVAPTERALIIATDLPAFERPDWFPSDIQVLDLTSYLTGMGKPLRVEVLLDLVRGLTPRRVVTVNSNLGWRMITTYGRQLAARTELGAYLFTWEINDLGFKGGYPIKEFEQGFEHLSWVLLDSDRLRSELVDRFLLPEVSRRRLVLARTPVEAPALDVAGVFERRRREREPLRAFWAGRFDRQKRFDLVIGVAEQLPELEIWAWGKPVLGDLDIDLDALPPNIRLMGVYDDFHDLPLGDLDFMLYTAQWDGIPTLVLDAAQSGLPIVASAVGGVPELVTDETGYPVVDALDASAYATAVKQLVADPAQATTRAAAMRERVARDFDPDDYRAIVARVLTGRRTP